jgi:diguanylate cyclase (GGDEF)-like protein
MILALRSRGQAACRRALRGLPWPQSLRAQCALAVCVLSLLILAAGTAAIWALRTANDATRRLAQEQLVSMQAAQDLLQRTMLVERETYRMLTNESPRVLHPSDADIATQLEALDRIVAGLADASIDATMLDLHQSSQLFRNTTHVVLQLRESSVRTAAAFDQILHEHTARLQAQPSASAAALAILLYRLAATDSSDAVDQLHGSFLRQTGRERPSPSAGRNDTQAHDPFALRSQLIREHHDLHRFHVELQTQAATMVATARLQSATQEGEYRAAARRAAETSRQGQRWVFALLASSLVFAWLVAHLFLGRYVVRRLQQVSRSLRCRGSSDGAQLAQLAHGNDEIADMARAVQQFRLDRQELERRTLELSLAKEQLMEQGRVLEMIAARAPLAEILDRLVRMIESQSPDVMASILLLDDDGLHLRHGAAPSLPAAYTALIDGVRVGPDVGSCGTAVHRGEPVIVTDIQADPLWANYCALAASHGLRACWSAPIFAHQQLSPGHARPHGARGPADEDTILGTFAMYSATVKAPTPTDMRLVDLATRIAGIAIERQKTEERIRHMAHHDELTGLPNRALLRDRLAQALLRAERQERGVAVAFIDLDDFKLINDSLGHTAGDELLQTVSTRLLHCVRSADTVVRLGGDEFVVILTDLPRTTDAVTPTLQRIVDTIARPVTLRERDVQISCSMGLATYPADGTTADDLLTNADAAMYRAKDLGRNNFQFYQAEMNGSRRQRLALQEGLRHAVARNELFLVYQPQVDLQSRQIIGVEALLRWRHPELGMVSPATFIPLAEASGLIVAIGDWVLHAACRQNKAWQDAGLPPITMAVNVSARQFRQVEWIERVADALHTSGLSAQSLELELTESLIMQDLKQAVEKMQQLRAMGLALAIDDFGTGYSSLGALKRFPLARLKIDRSFVQDIATDEDDKAIVMAVIELGHRLNLKVLAEGVETEEQLAFLRQCQCDEMQGYLFSRPVPPAEIAGLLARQARLPAQPQPASSEGAAAVHGELDAGDELSRITA